MQAAATSQDTPFFIVYLARSGSTFLANELMRRGRVCLFPETNFVPVLLREFADRPIATEAELGRVVTALEKDKKFSDWAVPPPTARAALQPKMPLSIGDAVRVICSLYLQQQESSFGRFGFKKGSYLRHFEALKRAFPEAQFIGLIRDGRGVYNSQKTSIQPHTGRPFETDAARCAEKWKRSVELIREAEARYPDATMVVSYERLVTATDDVVQRVMEFLQIEPRQQTETCEAAYPVTPRYGDLHRNVGRPPLEARASAWRQDLTPREIRLFQKTGGITLEAEGYELVPEADPRWLPRFRAVLQRIAGGTDA